MNKVYLIKNLNPWMMNELLAFSKLSNFLVILIRKPDDFYKDDLNKLRKNNIEIIYEPFNYNEALRKLIFIFKFLFKNFLNFFIGYSAVLGWKSLYWFYKLDISLFEPPLNLHAQFATQAAIISLLIKKYLKNDVEYSFTFHAHDIYFDNRWFPALVNDSKQSFSISEFNISYVKNKFKDFDPKKIKLSRLGVFYPQLNSAGKKHDVNSLIVGFMSWFVQKKGINYLLEAINQLKNEKDIVFKIAGDGPLKNFVINYIKHHELDDNVKYLGKLKGDQKDDFFKSIDVFILPSIKTKKDMDGIPVVLMEAISYGIPLISTNISGIPEICRNRKNGILVPEKDVDAIVDAVIYMYKNKEKIKKYSFNSLNISKKYDIVDNCYKKMKLMNWI